MPSLGLTEGEFVSVPLGFSYIMGGNIRFLELGLGTTLAYAEGTPLFSSEKEQEFEALINATIGYRLQPPDKSFFFKIAFTPLFSPGTGNFLPFGGLSVGYSF